MRSSLATLACLALLLGACDRGEVPKGDAAAGRVLAERNCVRCHAIGSEAESPVTEAPPFRELMKRWPPENLAEALAEGIQVSHAGETDMPEFTFQPEEIDDLIAYLSTLEPAK